MTAVYVQRANGGVVGVFANPQPGYATEQLDASDPAVLAYLNPLPAYAASKRYAVETGGCIIDGVAMLTDRDTQSKLMGAFLLAQANPATAFDWKTAGGFVTLSAAQISAIAVAVGSFVQAAFATEATVQASIAAGTTTTMAQIDAAAWPSNQ